MIEQPSVTNNFLHQHAILLCESYTRLTGRALVSESAEGESQAEALFNAPFVQLSHDVSDDPRFTYANLTAMDLFEMQWHELVGMPSRYSAEAPDRHERARLLECVSRDGFIDDYSGVRISKTGKRFLIKAATVWNMIDEAGICHGQAAMFDSWQML